MLLASSLIVGLRTTRRSVRRASRLRVFLLLGALPMMLAANSYAADLTAVPVNEGFFGGIAIVAVLAAVVVVFARTRVKSAERELTRLKELADHREYERNVAQQELVRRLEEARELAKERMQFESQRAPSKTIHHGDTEDTELRLVPNLLRDLCVLRGRFSSQWVSRRSM